MKRSKLLKTITRAAGRGESGDGKISVMIVEDAVHVTIAEEGDNAI
jgi:nitrogen regulatory protein PII